MENSILQDRANVNNLSVIMFRKFLSFVFIGVVISFNLYIFSKEEKAFAISILENFINEQNLNSKIQVTDLDWFYLEPTVFQESVSYFFFNKGDINIFGDIHGDSFTTYSQYPKIIKEIFERENAELRSSGSYFVKVDSFEYPVIYQVFSLSSERFVLVIIR